MARALTAGSYLASALLGVSLLLLVVGLAMVARPEAFVGLGVPDPHRTGLETALLAGFGAIATSVLGRILELVRGSIDEAGNGG